MRTIRWLVVPLSAVAVWTAALLLGLAGITVLDSLCPPDLMVSGLCTASWHAPAVKGLEMICAAFAAAGVVAVPTVIAPHHRVQVAAVCLVGGAMFALFFAIAAHAWADLAAAAISGCTAFYLMRRRFRSSGSD